MFLVGVLGILPSTLIFDASQAAVDFITFSQAYTFGLTFFGLLFLFLGISTSKGSLPLIKTNLMFFLVGGTILGYFNTQFYHLTLDTITNTWVVHYNPFFLLFISCAMGIIVIDLMAYAKLIFRTGSRRIKHFTLSYFIGWVVLASSGVVFFWSRIDYTIPANLYLAFFSFGVLIISFVIFLSPANLIASPLKVFNISFVNSESGLPYISYNFRRAEIQVEPALFSEMLVGMSLAVTETVKGYRYLTKIEGIDRKVLLERGLITQAILTVEDETFLFRKILRRLLILFEMQFFISLDNKERLIDSGLYSKFGEQIKTYFAFA
ncbi:MAG: hypothetical protein ACXADY_06695 [Candidatus Hodarchaeales archaeon]|jgi:hypothetical protein